MSNSTAARSTDTPRYALAWATLTFIALVLTLGYPALSGGFLVTPVSDQYIGGFPVRDFAAQSLKAGLGIPLWNPYLFGGMPYVAAMGVGDIYYWTTILRGLLPVDVAMTLSLMIGTLACGLTMYGFCRAVGLSFRASLIGGAAYMMSGAVAGLVSPGHDGKLYVSGLLPATLTCLIHAVRFGRLWAWGAFALVIGLAVLSPHPQLLQYMLLVAGAFTIYLAFGEWHGERLSRVDALKRVGIAFAMVGVGFLMGAVQYAPFIGYIPFSPRGAGTSYEFATQYSYPIEEFLNAYLPQFSGILDAYWGRNGIHFHSDYVGAVSLVLATAAIGATGKAQAVSRSFKLFMLGVLVVALVWAMGGFTPFYRLVWVLVPGTKFFRAPSTIIYVAAFAIALFAAIGAERALAGWFSNKFAAAWGAFAVVVTLLAASGGLSNFAATVAESAARSRLPAIQAANPNVSPDAIMSALMRRPTEQIAANASATTLGSLRSLFFVAVVLVALWGRSRGVLTTAQAFVGLLVIGAADLWSIERHYWRFSAPAAQLYRSDPTIDFLKARRDSARVMTAALSDNYEYHDPFLFGDGLMVHGIRQVTGYHGNEIGRYRNLTDGGLNPSLWSLLNVRYLLTNAPPTDSSVARYFGSQTRLVAGPSRDAAGTMVYLYQLPGDNPPAWVATSTLKAPDDASLATVKDPRFNAETQRRVALVDTASPTRATADPAKLPAPSPLTAQVQRPTHSRIVVDLSAPAQDGNMLIVSENFYPGWIARVDGKPASAERVDYTLLGVPLTAGARKIELEFTSAASGRGKLISIFAGSIALLILIVGLVQRRGTPIARVA